LGVCWRGKRASSVRIALKVGRGGQVSAAAHQSGGAVGQCAAGVLAVQTLPGAGYDAVVEIPTTAGGAGARTAETIDEDLARHRAALEACAGGAAGQIAIKFLIQPDGRMRDPKVMSSTLGKPAAEACMVEAIAARSVRVAPSSKALYYTLVLALGAGGSATAGGASAGGALTPSKDGPISSEVLSKVMNEARPKLTACYDRVARTKKGLAGVVWLRFTIRDDGTTRNVAIKESTLGNAAVETCLVKAGQGLRFPGEKGRAKTRVFYPLSFSQRY
ncbi:MAG TPA: AgmX/PglI C-terminal domain-containing protein, partial [Kofleriaceae bacterium]|nr:AgmX/PglI C-terminal domain-containing protein [Kofleriaceae bacterium]